MNNHIYNFRNYNLIKEGKQISSNVEEFTIQNIDEDIIKKFQTEYPDKWILYSKELNYLWIKSKPNQFDGIIPDKVYHVSKIDKLDEIGIKPSTETESPFGYYNISFFYLDEEDAEYGSVLHTDNTFLYEVDTNATEKWLEGFNEELDGEENITTSDFIEPQYINKIA